MDLKQIPFVLFCLYGSKALILPVKLTDLIALGLLGIYSYFHYYALENKKVIQVAESHKQIKEELEVFKTDLANFKTQVQSVKLAQGFKTQTLR